MIIWPKRSLATLRLPRSGLIVLRKIQLFDQKFQNFYQSHFDQWFINVPVERDVCLTQLKKGIIKQPHQYRNDKYCSEITHNFRWKSIILFWKFTCLFFYAFVILTRPSAGALEYTDCFSAGWVKTSLMSVLFMTLSNLMLSCQWCWSFGECRAHVHCNCSQAHSSREW